MTESGRSKGGESHAREQNGEQMFSSCIPTQLAGLQSVVFHFKGSKTSNLCRDYCSIRRVLLPILKYLLGSEQVIILQQHNMAGTSLALEYAYYTVESVVH